MVDSVVKENEIVNFSTCGEEKRIRFLCWGKSDRQQRESKIDYTTIIPGGKGANGGESTKETRKKKQKKKTKK